MRCCRDLDSKITRRESAAVSEFVQSGAGIHSMRDNPYHDNPMMGCSWGSNLKAANIRKMWKSSWKTIMNDKLAFSSRKIKGPDQTLLTRHIWPWGRNMSLQHDSYLSARNTRDQSDSQLRELMKTSTLLEREHTPQLSLTGCGRNVHWCAGEKRSGNFVRKITLT